MWCKPSSQFFGTILETKLWRLEQGRSNIGVKGNVVELITIHYLISNQIEFKVQNKFAMSKKLKLNKIYTQLTDRIFVILPHLLGPRCVSF